MARFPRARFLAVAMVFHLVYIYSIFDIYFVSPIVSGMQLFALERPVESKAPADRLVLFVGESPVQFLFRRKNGRSLTCLFSRRRSPRR